MRKNPNKKCSACRKIKSIKDFWCYKSKRRNSIKIAVPSKCKVCAVIYHKKWYYSSDGQAFKHLNKERRNSQHKKYRQSKKGKIVQIRKANKMWLKYPEKRRAREQLRYAVRTGKIIKSLCEVCNDSVVFGHHNDYNKPLEVNWLCMTHHREVHFNKS